MYMYKPRITACRNQLREVVEQGAPTMSRIHSSECMIVLKMRELERREHGLLTRKELRR